MKDCASLIVTGVLLGIVHVLTGPDHLSALATLSANVDCKKSFFLGVRWGIGHSTGLLIVGVFFILLTRTSGSETIDIPEGVSRFFESLVGIFMIMLGLYGIRKALHHGPDKPYGALPESHVPANTLADDSDGSSFRPYHTHDISNVVTGSDLQDRNNAVSIELGDGSSPNTTSAIFIERTTSAISARTLALFAGIIHGFAGPGGVLGVIPAIQLHDGKLATLYLFCFCVSSTLTMGTFAVLYGTFSKRLGEQIHSAFKIEILSASLSLLVGVTWLFLLSIGKLEDVFP